MIEHILLVVSALDFGPALLAIYMLDFKRNRCEQGSQEANQICHHTRL